MIVHKRPWRRVAVALAFWSLASSAAALEVPPYKSAVNDLAGLLSSSEESRLESRIRTYRDSTGIEIGILTVESLEGVAIEDFAHDVFRAWGVGDSARDNGVLFVVAWQDHLARLEVGYGIEGALTDIESGRIVSKQSEMASHFRTGDLSAGFLAVLHGIELAVAGDYDPPPRRAKKPSSQVSLLGFLSFMVFAMIMAAITRRRARKMGVWGHGSWGSVGLGALGGLGGFGRGSGGGHSSGGGFHFGGGSSGGGGASGGW